MSGGPHPGGRGSSIKNEYRRKARPQTLTNYFEMDIEETLNHWLDELPRPRLGCFGREVPTFRTCGIVGFYLAVMISIGATLLAGRSVAVFAVLALVSGLSFFVYAHLRKWIAGFEELVLLEQVWFALACNAAALWLMREPLLPYLDIVSIGLCPFLAAGRVGCTLVGCCHGNPSSFGITYSEACAADGFSSHLVGVRLFPVAAIEAAGLLAIGASGLIALPLATPGKVFSWYLLAYSVMRFGLEGIRGDRRPHFLGLSQARWMSIVEVVFAIELTSLHLRRGPALAVYTTLFALLIAILAIRWSRDWRRLMLTPRHCREVRDLAQHLIANEIATRNGPTQRLTSQKLSLVISDAKFANFGSRGCHVSLTLPGARGDLWLLCDLASRAFPELVSECAQLSGGWVLHLFVPAPRPDMNRNSTKGLAEHLYGALLRQLEQKTSVSHIPLTTPADASAWCFGGGRKTLG